MKTTKASTLKAAGDHLSLRPYLVGYIYSLALTLAAYILVDEHVQSGHRVFSHRLLLMSILGLAVVQLMVQLIFFLHLDKESKPRWNLIVMLFAILVVLIIVIGSIWIMYHLNYNMMTPQQTDKYVQNQENIHH